MRLPYVCKHCGNTFSSERKKEYCSRDCSLAYRREHNRHELIKPQPEPKPKRKKKSKMTIAEIDAAARKAGLSYGKYVAREGL